MKKIILFLITITTFTNVSYASFPVKENMQNKIVETIVNEDPDNFFDKAATLSWILVLILMHLHQVISLLGL